MTAAAGHATAPAPGRLVDDFESLKICEGSIDGRHADPRLVDELAGGEKRTFSQEFMDTQRRAAAIAFRSDPLAIRLEKADDACRGLESPVRRIRDVLREEIEPGLQAPRSQIS